LGREFPTWPIKYECPALCKDLKLVELPVAEQSLRTERGQSGDPEIGEA
jgi:hypothetical protein